MALRHGRSRSLLHHAAPQDLMPRPCAVVVHVHRYITLRLKTRCHGLAPWSLTFTTTSRCASRPDATALRRGSSRSPLHHAAPQDPMPRPCAVVVNVHRYNKRPESANRATSRVKLPRVLAANVKYH